MTHYKGNYSKYLELKAEQLASEWKAYEKQQEEINKLEDFVAKIWFVHLQQKRAQKSPKSIRKMDRLDRPQGDEKSAHFLFDSEKSREMLFYKSKMPPLVTTKNIFYRTYSLGYSSQRSHCLSRTERNW